MAEYLTVNSFGGLAMGFPANLMADNQMLQFSEDEDARMGLIEG